MVLDVAAGVLLAALVMGVLAIVLEVDEPSRRFGYDDDIGKTGMIAALVIILGVIVFVAWRVFHF